MTTQVRNDIDNLLAESFKELAKKQSISKITIQQITDKAGVIRPTFYNHFQDKYELLEWIISEELFKPIQPLIQNKMMSEALLLVFTKIEKEKDFYKKIVKLDGQNSFEEIAENSIVKVILQVMEINGKQLKEEYKWLTPERIARYYSKVIIYVVKEWVEGDMDVSPQDIVATHNYMISKPITEFL